MEKRDHHHHHYHHHRRRHYYQVISRIMKVLVNKKITVPGSFQG